MDVWNRLEHPWGGGGDALLCFSDRSKSIDDSQSRFCHKDGLDLQRLVELNASQLSISFPVDHEDGPFSVLGMNDLRAFLKSVLFLVVRDDREPVGASSDLRNALGLLVFCHL